MNLEAGQPLFVDFSKVPIADSHYIKEPTFADLNRQAKTDIQITESDY